MPYIPTTKHGPAEVFRHSSSNFIRSLCSSGLSHSSGSMPQYRSTTWKTHIHLTHHWNIYTHTDAYNFQLQLIQFEYICFNTFVFNSKKFNIMFFFAVFWRMYAVLCLYFYRTVKQRKQNGTGSGKVQEPELDLGMPKAQHVSMLLASRRRQFSGVFRYFFSYN